jgi:hypothetical protein
MHDTLSNGSIVIEGAKYITRNLAILAAESAEFTTGPPLASHLKNHSLSEPALQKLRELASWDFEKVDCILMVKSTRSPVAPTPAVSQAFSDEVSRHPIASDAACNPVAWPRTLQRLFGSSTMTKRGPIAFGPILLVSMESPYSVPMPRSRATDDAFF